MSGGCAYVDLQGQCLIVNIVLCQSSGGQRKAEVPNWQRQNFLERGWYSLGVVRKHLRLDRVVEVGFWWRQVVRTVVIINLLRSETNGEAADWHSHCSPDAQRQVKAACPAIRGNAIAYRARKDNDWSQRPRLMKLEVAQRRWQWIEALGRWLDGTALYCVNQDIKRVDGRWYPAGKGRTFHNTMRSLGISSTCWKLSGDIWGLVGQWRLDCDAARTVYWSHSRN